MTSIFDDAFKRADAENTGQRVYYTIQGLKQKPNETRKRWVWELLQNAHDARQVGDQRTITVEIEYSQEELIFLHNGRRFNADEIAHLIRSGSTKDETDETTHGQYGTGLLTTHLLSPGITISGQLEDDQWFDFTFERDDTSWEALLDSLDEAIKAFTDSHSLNKPLKLGDFTTRFGFPTRGEDAKRAVRTGIETLKQSAPYMLVFNETFRSINIKDHEGTLCFEVVDSPNPDVPIQQITVMEHKNGNASERGYLLAQNKKKTSVIVPLGSNKERNVCLQVEKTPRVFKGFPLVDTEFFSFPAVINNPNFTVPSTRDNLPLEESSVNKTNRDSIKEACVLLVDLLKHAASNKWYHLPRWVKVPPIENQNSSGMDWLKTDALNNLIEKIRETGVVLNTDDNIIAPSAARLPLLNSENGEAVEVLWDLLENVQGFRETLPRREEAAEWCNALQDWARIYEREASTFNEAFDGKQLAQWVHKVSHDLTAKTTTHRISLLDLKKDIVEIKWLDALIGFLQKNGLSEIINQYWIVPSQESFLRPLGRLSRDPGIDDDLKDIAELLDWRIRCELRDSGLNSLTEVEGDETMNLDEVVNRLCEKIIARANQNPDDDFKVASTQLFAWIINKEKLDLLQGFPMFTDNSKPNSSPVLRLPTAHMISRPLAPFRAWTKDLEQFSEVFPPELVLADAFFEALPSPDTWKMLDDEKKLIRWNMLICRNEVDLKMLSPDPEVYEDNKTEHKATHPICVTDVVELEKILKEVAYDSRERGYKFWQFLTEWLVNKDIQGLEIVSEGTPCECGQTHEYYPAAWVMLVRKVNWIRDGTPRHFPEAEHLAKLLQEKGWDLSSLNENPGIGKLLKAMNVDPSTLKRLFIPDTVINTAVMLSENPQLAHHMEDNEKRHQIEQILNKVGDDLPLVSEAVQDEKFLEEYEKKKEQDLTMQANKSLGLLVEEMVGQILDEKKFKVESNHRGWDFDMTGHITELEVVQSNSSKTWRVEVKTTRTEDNHQGVRMSFPQAQEAVKHGKEYLLCVVPLGQEDATPENVRKKMLFIEDIGGCVKPLYKKLDKLKKMRDGIIDDATTDLQLIVEEGKSGVLIKRPIWEAGGFPLTDLLERLE